jgi:hypothetical protein
MTAGLAVIFRFGVVLLIIVIVIIIIDGVSRRLCVADEAQQDENALGDVRGHAGLPLDVTTFTDKCYRARNGIRSRCNVADGACREDNAVSRPQYIWKQP